MKTENLAIVMTDIAGYTEATAHLSRRDNERLLDNHNRILLPVIKRFKGTLVKTIGDALLMVFRSPTDAMLCSMAMQDALFEYNRTLPEEQQIHVRVAASLGEVRVTRNDIFGEPVNTTSRIEGITPPDEIYLSDAVYMAMNKAEVPCREVGLRQLKGISEQVRIWQIPRFSRPRLVPEDVMSAEDMSEIVFPYGGAHLLGRRDEASAAGEGFGGRRVLTGVAAACVLAATAGAFYYFGSAAGRDSVPALPAAQPEVVSVSEPVGTPVSEDGQPVKPEETVPPATPDEAVKQEAAPVPVPEASLARATPAPAGTAEAGRPSVPDAAPEKPAAAPPAPTRKPAPVSAPVVQPAEKPLKVVVREPIAAQEIELVAEEDDESGTSFSELKSALRAGTLTREEYNGQIQNARQKLRDELKAARDAYAAGELDRKAYKEKVTEIKQKYR